jgi:hypothetical protein
MTKEQPNQALERDAAQKRGAAPQLVSLSRRDKLGASCGVEVPVG